MIGRESKHLRVKQWQSYLPVTNSSLTELKTFSAGGKRCLLLETQLTTQGSHGYWQTTCSHYFISIIPNNNLYICPYNHRKAQSFPIIKETSLCNRDHYIKLQPHKMQSCRVQPQRIYLQILQEPMLREHCGRREDKIKELEDQKVCCEVVFSRNIRSYTHKIQPICLLK